MKRFRNRSFVIVTALLLSFSLCLETAVVNAASLSDIRKKISDKQNQLEEGKKEEKNLTDQILKMEDEIQKMEHSISKNENRLSQLLADLEEAEKKADTQNNNLGGRLRNMYKSGSIGFIDVLLESGSFSEFLINLDLVERIYASDKNVLDGLQQICEEIDSKKKEVETLQSELKESKKELTAKKAEVEEQKKKVMASNDALEEDLEELEKESQRITALINGSASTGTVYSGGQMAWPVPSNGSISSPYGYRTHPIYGTQLLHSGMDIPADTGSSIVAANSGTVISAGWNGGYGNCVIVDHGGGICTLYGHNSSLAVSYGQKVSRGQTIAYAGSTGNSTGSHCHFEVRINGNCVNPLPYVR